jgi:HNH endonuclease
MSPGKVSDELRERVREQAEDRCGYCRCAQRYVFGPLEIDHIIPTARSGTDDEDNLWLACWMCNRYKGAQTSGFDPHTGRRTKLFNPRQQSWTRHFTWSRDGTIIVGRTATGRVTVAGLQLNNVIAVLVRREWVSAGWHPPE